MTCGRNAYALAVRLFGERQLEIFEVENAIYISYLAV